MVVVEWGPACGTRSRYVAGCRCPECRAANASYALRRNRARGVRPAAEMVGEGHPNWRGDAAKTHVKRVRAHRVIPELGPCEKCGAPARDRHHIDGDTGNNVPENLTALCRRCHMEVDGRLARMGTEIKVPKQPPKVCIECGRLHKPSRKGLCPNCYMRAWKRARKAAA